MKANKKRFIPQLADFTPATDDFAKLLANVIILIMTKSMPNFSQILN